MNKLIYIVFLILFFFIEKNVKNLLKFIIIFLQLFLIYNYEDYVLNNRINNISNDILNNSNIISENDKDYLLKIKSSKIENIILLVEIMPFLKKDLLIYPNKNKDLFKFFNRIFYEKEIFNNNILRITPKDIYYLIANFNELWNYKWEIFPELEEINRVRYIINNYYNESFLEIFDKALNLNLRLYIQNKKNKFSLKEIKQLMSKLFSFIINIYL